MEQNGHNMPVSELLQLNARVMQQMMNEIRSYNNTHRKMDPPSMVQASQNGGQRFNMGTRDLYDNMYEARRESVVNHFDERRKEYDSMSNPPQPDPVIFLEDDNGPLSNIGELVERQLKNRAIDMNFYVNDTPQSPQPSNNIISSRNKNPSAISISALPGNLPLTDVVMVEDVGPGKNVSWTDTFPEKDDTTNAHLNKVVNLITTNMEKITNLLDTLDARIAASESEYIKYYSENNHNMAVIQNTISHISSSVEKLMRRKGVPIKGNRFLENEVCPTNNPAVIPVEPLTSYLPIACDEVEPIVSGKYWDGDDNVPVENGICSMMDFPYNPNDREFIE